MTRHLAAALVAFATLAGCAARPPDPPRCPAFVAAPDPGHVPAIMPAAPCER